MRENYNRRYHKLVEDINSVTGQHGLEWQDIKSLLWRHRSQFITPVRRDVCIRIDKAGESIVFHKKVPEDLEAFRLFVAELNEALDLSLPLDVFQGRVSLIKKWAGRVFSGAFFLFITYMVFSGIFFGSPISTREVPPLARLFLVLLLMLFVALLEGSQIGVAKTSMTELDPNGQRYRHIYSVHKKLRTREGSDRYYAGRQFCVFAILFIVAQLTSFHSVEVWPFAGDVLPPWLESGLTRVFFQFGEAGALLMLWFGSLAPQFWANKNSMGFLNFWLTPYVIQLCWFVESLGLARPATWVAGLVKTADKPPTSSRERYYQETENAGYSINMQKKIWSIRAVDSILRSEVSYVLRKQDIDGIVDNSLFINGESLRISFSQQLICSDLLGGRNVSVRGRREVSLDNGWRQFVREFECDFGDFLTGDVVLAGSETRIPRSQNGDNILLDLISVNSPTKCILFRIEFLEQPVKVGTAALQIYRRDVHNVDESTFIPALRDPIPLMPKKTDSGTVIFEYSELYPAVGTCYVLSYKANFLTPKSENPRIEVLS